MRRQSIEAGGKLLTLYLILLTFLSGCSSIRPSSHLLDKHLSGIPEHFDYTPYSRMLDTYVNDEGYVDYESLKNSPDDLDSHYARVAAYSPDSHPNLFPSHDHKLAYWLNAYNSTVIKGVLEHYPIEGVADVQEPALLFFFPEKSGFFFFQRYTYGGVETSLYYLENSVIRKRFADPRIHFALNCASRSCPALPSGPFLPHLLEQQLEEEAGKFINSDQNVRFDEKLNTFYLSAIFDWYRDDFLNYLKLNGSENPTLLDYIRIYAEDDLASLIERDSDPEIAFLEYDWGLNDQRFQIKK